MEEEYSFTGMWCRKFDREKKAKYMAKVNELKKKYRCKCKQVSEDGGIAWYGDANFLAVQYDSEEKCQEMIDSVPERAKKLEEEYKKKLEELEEWKQMWVDKKHKFEELRK